ncbi:Calx-beta domain-containing protein [Aliamphritea spongicola]|nr:Calx-beta domain-containing protein [Aliamphritea spongicola]
MVEGETTTDYTVSLSEAVPAGKSVTVALTYSYTTASGTDITEVADVTITGPASSATFNIATIDDALAEGAEDFTVSLGTITDTNDAFEAIVAGTNNSVETTITDQTGSDNPPGTEDTVYVRLTQNVDSIGEDGGQVTYTVTLVDENDQPITVPAGETVTVGLGYTGSADSSEYTGEQASVTFTAGQSQQQFVVTSVDDAVSEPNENIIVDITSITDSGAFENVEEHADNQVTTLVIDDDGTPQLSINDVSVNEDDGVARFTVTLSPVSASTVTVDFATASGTATQSADFTGVSGTLTFNAGDNTAFIDVPITDDVLAEGIENFVVNLTNAVNADIADNQGQGSIVDETTPSGDDTVIVSLTGPSDVVEGETTTDYTVSLSEAVPAGKSVTVALTYSYTTASGTDITEVADVTITGPASSATFNIATIDDALAEGAEDFTVSLGTITDTNDAFEAIVAGTNNSVETTITDQTGSDNPPGTEDTVIVS